MAKTIRVDALARVEGEGALTIRFAGKRPKSVELRIFEPPRLFEAFLRGRSPLETPDITARICGICPVAYQMSACRAVEHALGIDVGPEIRALRRLLYCGEWVESHALSVFMLHLPDFLGHPDAISMARDHRELVLAGLAIKKAGNSLMARLGGREIHPVNVRIGGFYRAPTRAELELELPALESAREKMLTCLERFAKLEFPAFERAPELVSLQHPEEYPMAEGRIVSSAGLDIDAADWEAHFVEEQVPHSTALHARLRERGPYLCGPLARFNLCFEQLRPLARDAARRIGLEPPVNNPFRALLVRSVEIVQALDDAIALIATYRRPAEPFVAGPIAPSTGAGATEAPRGLLYHRYAIGADGLIADAKIVPPTSQNQRSIELDLFEIAGELAELPPERATVLAEQTIRNHDPCISCATHFLKLAIERDPPPVAAPLTARVRVVAFGERTAGDDAVALDVLDELARRELPLGVALHRARSASELCELLAEDQTVIVIDALVGASAGSVREIDPGGLALESAISGHALGVAQALALARNLGLPGIGRLRVVGIGIADPRRAQGGLSHEARGAVVRAADFVLELLGRSRQ